MSAFIVSEETLHLAVFAMATEKVSGHGIPNTNESCDMWGQKMRELNYRAVNTRYGETDPAPEGYRYKGRWDYDLIHALKALECLRYQCAEGDLDKSTLWRQMRDRANAICRKIVFSMPEYEKAPWDIT